MDVAPVFPSFTPGRETTIKDFLTRDLKLTERILGYDIYVNGKEIDLDFWSDFIVNPGDNILIAPYIGLLEEIHDIEAEIMVEGNKRWDAQQPLNLDSNKIETLYEFYKRLSGPAYERSSLQSGTPSKYTPHFKFLIDESIRILVDNDVINNRLPYLDRVKSLSKIVSTSQSEDAVMRTFNKEKTGTKFDLTESYLMSWYAGMWYEIEKAYDRGDILSTEDKNNVLYELDELLNAQYNLYGVGKPSKAYLSMRQAYEKLKTLIYEETNICPDRSDETFRFIFKFNPMWHHKDTYTKPDYVPNIAYWNSLFSNIISELKSRSLDHLIPIINSINKEMFDIILYHARNPLADMPNWPKRELLENIIDCQDMNLLKVVTQLKDLSFILFNHPSYGISAGKTSNYLTNAYFDKEGMHPGTISALLHRISTLTLNDFEKIGLGDKLDDGDLIAFKEHAKEAVSDWIQKYGIISYDGVGTNYRTNYLMDLQFDTFKALWTAVAYRENDFFISYSKVFKTFGLWKGFYNEYVTHSSVVGARLAGPIINKLDQFIMEESYSISVSYSAIVNMDSSLQDPNKILVYKEAKNKLVELQAAKQEAQEAWLKSEKGVKTWFDGLFEPSTRDSRYTQSFREGSSFYKAWLIIMELLESFGTDYMTGESIPNAAFDKPDDTAIFANHHMDRSNKMSNALYDIFLTWTKGGYHPDPYESFSELNGIHSQRLLKYRLRKLFELGINKDEIKDKVQNSQWITEADFRTMFPDSLEYEVEYKNTKYKGSLYYLWNDVFTKKSFQEKLETINNKITSFKEASSKGYNPHVAVLSKFLPAAESRFLVKASKFADRFWMLGSEYSFSDHDAEELARIWQVYLMKVTFDLD